MSDKTDITELVKAILILRSAKEISNSISGTVADIASAKRMAKQKFSPYIKVHTFLQLMPDRQAAEILESRLSKASTGIAQDDLGRTLTHQYVVQALEGVIDLMDWFNERYPEKEAIEEVIKELTRYGHMTDDKFWRTVSQLNPKKSNGVLYNILNEVDKSVGQLFRAIDPEKSVNRLRRMWSSVDRPNFFKHPLGFLHHYFRPSSWYRKHMPEIYD